jgi:hypothetical protein
MWPASFARTSPGLVAVDLVLTMVALSNLGIAEITAEEGRLVGSARPIGLFSSGKPAKHRFRSGKDA